MRTPPSGVPGRCFAGGIQARIDSHNKILYARRDNERVVTFEKVCFASLRVWVWKAAALRLGTGTGGGRTQRTPRAVLSELPPFPPQARLGLPL